MSEAGALKGHCLCGEVRFLAEVDPARVLLCNCDDCQTHSGTAFRVVALCAKEDFRLEAGTLPRTPSACEHSVILFVVLLEVDKFGERAPNI